MSPHYASLSDVIFCILEHTVIVIIGAAEFCYIDLYIKTYVTVTYITVIVEIYNRYCGYVISIGIPLHIILHSNTHFFLH